MMEGVAEAERRPSQKAVVLNLAGAMAAVFAAVFGAVGLVHASTGALALSTAVSAGGIVLLRVARLDGRARRRQRPVDPVWGDTPKTEAVDWWDMVVGPAAPPPPESRPGATGTGAAREDPPATVAMPALTGGGGPETGVSPTVAGTGAGDDQAAFAPPTVAVPEVGDAGGGGRAAPEPHPAPAFRDPEPQVSPAVAALEPQPVAAASAESPPVPVMDVSPLLPAAPAPPERAAVTAGRQEPPPAAGASPSSGPAAAADTEGVAVGPEAGIPTPVPSPAAPWEGPRHVAPVAPAAGPSAPPRPWTGPQHAALEEPEAELTPTLEPSAAPGPPPAAPPPAAPPPQASPPRLQQPGPFPQRSERFPAPPSRPQRQSRPAADILAEVEAALAGRPPGSEAGTRAQPPLERSRPSTARPGGVLAGLEDVLDGGVTSEPGPPEPDGAR
jgi:hypothetical protein